MCCSDFSSSVGRLYPPLDLQGQDEAARKARGIQGTRMPETLQSRCSEAADALDVLGEGEQLLLQGPQFNGKSFSPSPVVTCESRQLEVHQPFRAEEERGLGHQACLKMLETGAKTC